MAEAPWKSVGTGFELGHWSFFPVAFLLSSACREVLTTFPPAHKEPTQAVGISQISSDCGTRICQCANKTETNRDTSFTVDEYSAHNFVPFQPIRCFLYNVHKGCNWPKRCYLIYTATRSSLRFHALGAYIGQYSKPDYICVCPNVLLWFAAGATCLVEVEWKLRYWDKKAIKRREYNWNLLTELEF